VLHEKKNAGTLQAALAMQLSAVIHRCRNQQGGKKWLSRIISDASFISVSIPPTNPGASVVTFDGRLSSRVSRWIRGRARVSCRIGETFRRRVGRSASSTAWERAVFFSCRGSQEREPRFSVSLSLTIYRRFKRETADRRPFNRRRRAIAVRGESYKLFKRNSASASRDRRRDTPLSDRVRRTPVREASL